MHLGAPPDGIMYHGGHDHGHDDSPRPGPTALDLTLGVSGEWHDRQTVDGVRDDNTGGHVVYFSPGLRLSRAGTTTAVTFGIPIATDLNGIQSSPDWRVSGSFGVQF